MSISSSKITTSRGQIRVLSVDDHVLIREGIAALIANQKDMQLVAEASTGHEAIEQFRLQRPDVTLMDLQMPEMNGIDALIAIRSEFPEARIIVSNDLPRRRFVQASDESRRPSLHLKRQRANGSRGHDPSRSRWQKVRSH